MFAALIDLHSAHNSMTYFTALPTVFILACFIVVIIGEVVPRFSWIPLFLPYTLENLFKYPFPTSSRLQLLHVAYYECFLHLNVHMYNIIYYSMKD